MGRLGPLTSQALGRSPYDDVVEGTGEADPREPEKQYDDKGRLINPRTKQAIKDTIRAHNEVMLVIGVAEPDGSGVTEAQARLNREYHEYEADTGRTMLHAGRSLGILSIWGVHGTRQRVLLYKRYNHIPFLDLWKHERQTQSALQIACTGLPAFLSMQALRWLSLSTDWVRGSRILQGSFAYLRFHLHLFLTMQRLGLIPSSRWIPHPSFFVPFSQSSPFLLPPAPRDTSAASLVQWTGHLAVNMAPYAAFYLCGRLWNSVHAVAWPEIFRRLPRPIPPRDQRASYRPSHSVRNSQSWPQQQQTAPESPTLGAADREIRHAQPPDADIPTLMALDGQGPSMGSEGIPVEAIRRRSTFSSRGGMGGGENDYGTDEEDAEMVNPTLISFDVDTSESAATDHLPAGGMWSAELRPSASAAAAGGVGADGHSSDSEGGGAPNYIVNPLTKLPAMLGADILTNFLAYLVSAPTDALALRGVARVYALKQGMLPALAGQMFDGNFLANLSVRGAVNLVGLEVVRLLISGDVWASVTMLSQWLHVTEEEWKDIHQKADNKDAPASGA